MPFMHSYYKKHKFIPSRTFRPSRPPCCQKQLRLRYRMPRVTENWKSKQDDKIGGNGNVTVICR